LQDVNNVNFEVGMSGVEARKVLSERSDSKAHKGEKKGTSQLGKKRERMMKDGR